MAIVPSSLEEEEGTIKPHFLVPLLPRGGGAGVEGLLGNHSSPAVFQRFALDLFRA